jgi:hypothetical protein
MTAGLEALKRTSRAAGARENDARAMPAAQAILV